MSLRNAGLESFDLIQFHTWEDVWLQDDKWVAKMNDLRNQGYFHAMDIHMNGVSAEYLGRLAALAHQGGVGFYTHRSQEFVHIDDGRVRYWRGNGKHKKRKT